MQLPESILVEDSGQVSEQKKIIFVLQKPKDADGNPWDQTGDAARHMRYAASLNLPQLKYGDAKPETHRMIIVGGGPSVKDELPALKALAADPNNVVFALNWTHTWLLNNGIVPTGCMMFEIDVDPSKIMDSTHPDVTYYVCSHCHPTTFDGLKDRKIVLWHSPPNSPGEETARNELFSADPLVPGGMATFMRTLPMGLMLGYRSFDIFGCDSSFPDDAPSTHVEGYPAIVNPKHDGFDVWLKHDETGEVRKFKTAGYLSYQVEEFKEFCRHNHWAFKCRVHGDTMLRWVHQHMWPEQYVG